MGWETRTITLREGLGDEATYTYDQSKNNWVLGPSGTGQRHYVATTGNDLTGDGTIGNPWRTVRYAAYISGQLHSGDELNLRGGTYDEGLASDTECIRVNNSGTAETPIIIRSYPGERAIIKPAHDWYIRPANINKPTFHLFGSHVWLYDLEIWGFMRLPDAPTVFTQHNNACCVSMRAGNQRVINCDLLNAQHAAIKMYSGTYSGFLIEGCFFGDIGTTDNDHFVYCAFSGNVNGIIRGCVGIRSTGYGLHFYIYPDECFLYNNQMYECLRDGYLTTHDKTTIAHNVSCNNRAGIRLYSNDVTNTLIFNNIITENSQSLSGPTYNSIRANTPGGSDNLVQANILVSRSGTWKEGGGIVTGLSNQFYTPETYDPLYLDLDIPNKIYRCRLQPGSSGIGTADPGVILPDVTLNPEDIGLFDAALYGPAVPAVDFNDLFIRRRRIWV